MLTISKNLVWPRGKKTQKENKNKQTKRKQTNKQKLKKIKKNVYDSLVLYLTKKWLNP
jgi:acyl-homoserine lactone acylase PvdQ